jgi:hypothetical protein
VSGQQVDVPAAAPGWLVLLLLAAFIGCVGIGLFAHEIDRRRGGRR